MIRRPLHRLRTVEMLSIDFRESSRRLPSAPEDNEDASMARIGAAAHEKPVLLPTTVQAHPHGRLAYLRNIAADSPPQSYAVPPGRRRTPGHNSPSPRRTAARAAACFTSGSSWEIERTGQWRELEDVFCMLAA